MSKLTDLFKKKKRKVVVRLNLPFVFMTLWILGLYIVFMKTALSKNPGVMMQGMVAFVVLFIPPCVFAYMSGYWNGAEVVTEEKLQGGWEKGAEK